MHFDPAHVSGSEFPNAQGNAHNIYRVIASLLFVLASITFFAGRIVDKNSQLLVLNGCILGFLVMFITVGLMTITQTGNLIIATIVFAILGALCAYIRLTSYGNTQ
jgi:uncharacterized membrane protein (UPF0136 family)